jgi:NAD(P)-dependent dehydrogenase (short-subunit alcohol dehydrogenase family)
MNNVGVIAMGPPEAIPVEAWSRLLDINILGVVRVTNTFLPLLLAQGSGHLINTASAAGLLSYGHDRLPYVASKHALVGMTEALARYLRPKGIGVSCLCPSGVITNIGEQITVFGAPDIPRAPDHAIVDADVVGELVCDAVDTGRFLIVTTPAVTDELLRRAADIEGYLDQLTD